MVKANHALSNSAQVYKLTVVREESRCSEETVIGWQFPSFGLLLPLSFSSLLFFGEDLNDLLQEVMLTDFLVNVVAIERSIFVI